MCIGHVSSSFTCDGITLGTCALPNVNIVHSSYVHTAKLENVILLLLQFPDLLCANFRGEVFKILLSQIMGIAYRALRRVSSDFGALTSKDTAVIHI